MQKPSWRFQYFEQEMLGAFSAQFQIGAENIEEKNNQGNDTDTSRTCIHEEKKFL